MRRDPPPEPRHQAPAATGASASSPAATPPTSSAPPPPERPAALEETLVSAEPDDTIEPATHEADGRLSSDSGGADGAAEADAAAVLHLPHRWTVRRAPRAGEAPTFLTSARRLEAGSGRGSRPSSPSEETVFDADEAATSGVPPPPSLPSPPPPPTLPPPPASVAPLAAPTGGADDPASTPDFVLDEVIGIGGQAEVWRATQPGLDREIAIKILHGDERPGHVVRFLQEAFTSAALDHPNIAPIYDLARARLDERGDCTQLAMKLIRGRMWHELLREEREAPGFTLDAFLARHLAIFVSVCHAVAYAHSKRIVHRDLKPKQVVVGEFGEVYLLDWGLALSLAEDVPHADGRALPKFRTRSTATNRSGTPAYMAPEQTDATTERLGYHTDIYLLGATLFEIVSGYPPHNAETASVAYTRAQRNDCEPLAPNAPAELRATIERALSPEPARRHRSVAELREEVEAYLTGAGRQHESRDLTQLASEWIRDRGAGAGYDVFVDLEKILTRALQLWPNNEAAGELRQDVQRRHARQALAHGDLQLARSLAPMILDAEERHALLDDVAQAEARERALDRRRRRLEVASVVLAVTLLYALVAGGVLFVRGRADAARALEQEAQAGLFRRINALREEEGRLARELRLLLPPPSSLAPDAGDEEDAGDGDALAALLARREALAHERAALAREPEMLEHLGRPSFDLVLATAHLALRKAVTRDDVIAAYRLYEAAHAQREEAPEPLTGLGVAASRAGFPTSATLHLGAATERTGRAYGPRSREYAEALALEAGAWQAFNDLSPDHVRLYEASLALLEPEWARLSQAIAERWLELGQFDRALEYASPTIALHARVAGDDAAAGESAPLDLARARLRTAGILARRGDYAAARELVEAGIATLRATLGERHAETATALTQLAGLEMHQADYARAEGLLRTALADRTALLGERDPRVAEVMDALSMTLVRLERFDDAEAMSRAAHGRLVDALGDRHPKSVQALNNLATVLERSGRHEEATPLLERALEHNRANYGADHPLLVTALNNLAYNLDSLDRLAEAEAAYREALTLGDRALGPMHPYVAVVLSNMSANLARQEGRDVEAMELMLRSLAIKEATVGAGHPSTYSLHNNIAFVAARAGRHREALRHYLHALTGYRALLGDENRSTALMYTNVAWMAFELERYDDAELLLRYSVRLIARTYGPDHAYVYSTGRRAHRVATIALERGPGGDAREVLRRGAWLDANMARYRPRMSRAQVIDDVIGADEAMTSAALRLDPPRRDLAARLVGRAASVAELIDLPTTHVLRRRFLGPRARELAIELRALGVEAGLDGGADGGGADGGGADGDGERGPDAPFGWRAEGEAVHLGAGRRGSLPPPPDDLVAAVREGVALDGAAMRAWLDLAGIEWGRDLPAGLAPYSLEEDLDGAADDTKRRRVEEVLEALAKEAATPPAPLVDSPEAAAEGAPREGVAGAAADRTAE